MFRWIVVTEKGENIVEGDWGKDIVTSLGLNSIKEIILMYLDQSGIVYVNVLPKNGVIIVDTDNGQQVFELGVVKDGYYYKLDPDGIFIEKMAPFTIGAFNAQKGNSANIDRHLYIKYTVDSLNDPYTGNKIKLKEQIKKEYIIKYDKSNEKLVIGG